MGEVERDPVLGWSHYLPHAVLIGWIEVRVGWTLDGAVSRVNVSSAGI